MTDYLLDFNEENWRASRFMGLPLQAHMLNDVLFISMADAVLMATTFSLKKPQPDENAENRILVLQLTIPASAFKTNDDYAVTWPVHKTSPVHYWKVTALRQADDEHLGFELILKQATHGSIFGAKLDVDLGASSTVDEVARWGCSGACVDVECVYVSSNGN